MGNCLITKLKGSVDNPNLPVLGEFKIHSAGQSSLQDGFRVGSYPVGHSVVYKTTDGALFLSNNSDTIENSTNQPVQVSTNAACDIKINPYYDISMIRINNSEFGEVYADELNRCLPYMTGLNEIQLMGVLKSGEVNLNLIGSQATALRDLRVSRSVNSHFVLNLDTFNATELRYCMISACPKCTGNVISFINKNPNLIMIDFRAAQVTGDVSDLDVNTNVTAQVVFADTLVTGSLAVARQKFPNASTIQPSPYMTE